MSFLTIFDIGKTALFASQAQLGVISNNIANASTPGYSRQEVILTIAAPVSQGHNQVVGQGVQVAGIRRQYDALLQNQIDLAQQEYGKSTTHSQNLSYIEQVFNETQGIGLATPMTDFFNAWHEVSNNPQGLTERSLLLQKADTLVNSAKLMEQGITTTLTQINSGIVDTVSKINAFATRIAKLNEQIAQVEAGSASGTANDFRDQRSEVLRQLNSLVNVNAWEDPTNGTLTVTLGNRNLVSGSNTNTLSAIYDQTANYIYKLDGIDITSKISKGELGGAVAASGNIQTHLLDLRKLVASLTSQVNVQHTQGYDLNGVQGTDFFTPIGFNVSDNSANGTLSATANNLTPLTLDNYAVTFADDGSGGYNYTITNSSTSATSTAAYDPAGTTVDFEGIRFVISGAVTATDSFTVAPDLSKAIQNFETAITDPREIAASSSAATVPGDNANALLMADIINQDIVELNSTTFTDYYQSLVGQIGSQSKTAADGLTYNNNFLTMLNTQRASISGVSMDEEAANLVRFQRAYQAAARLIQTADVLFEDLINLAGR
jgi:flagellar hook-associated protein 1 FlgK